MPYPPGTMDMSARSPARWRKSKSMVPAPSNRTLSGFMSLWAIQSPWRGRRLFSIQSLPS